MLVTANKWWFVPENGLYRGKIIAQFLIFEIPFDQELIDLNVLGDIAPIPVQLFIDQPMTKNDMAKFMTNNEKFAVLGAFFPKFGVGDKPEIVVADFQLNRLCVFIKCHRFKLSPHFSKRRIDDVEMQTQHLVLFFS